MTEEISLSELKKIISYYLGETVEDLDKFDVEHLASHLKTEFAIYEKSSDEI